jgi:heat shock protein HslJ
MNSKSLLFPFLILLTLVSGCQKAAVSSRPAAPGYSSAELENTYWKLLTIYAQKVTTTPDQSREALLQFQKNEKKSRGFRGCNKFYGK